MTTVPSLPKGIELSPHLIERASRFIVVSYIGQKLYIAETPPLRRLIGIDKPKSRDWSRQMDADDALRDIIDSIALQLRDNVFAGIEENITESLLEEMRELMQPKIQQKISEKVKRLGQ